MIHLLLFGRRHRVKIHTKLTHELAPLCLPRGNLLNHSSSKTTEIYPHIAVSNFSRIKNSLGLMNQGLANRNSLRLTSC